MVEYIYMNKHKLTKKEILHVVILSIIYATWIISIHVVMSISGYQDDHIMYANIVGSILALIYVIFLNYPLIPIISRYINARTENEAVKIRHEYAIRALYCIILGFFLCTFLMFLKLDNFEEHPLAQSWHVVGIGTALMIIPYAIFSIKYVEKMRILVYVDKLQHKNADIEG